MSEGDCLEDQESSWSSLLLLEVIEEEPKDDFRRREGETIIGVDSFRDADIREEGAGGAGFLGAFLEGVA